MNVMLSSVRRRKTAVEKWMRFARVLAVAAGGMMLGGVVAVAWWDGWCTGLLSGAVTDIRPEMRRMELVVVTLWVGFGAVWAAGMVAWLLNEVRD